MSPANQKARASKSFWGLKIKLRYRIVNILCQNLNDIINAVADHELILDQDAAAKRTCTIIKPAISTPTVKRLSRQQGAGSNPNKRKRDGECCSYKCQNCGQEHTSSCPEPIKCFNCGKSGQIQKDCELPPKVQQQGKAGNNLPQNDRGEPELFDTGCTLSFIEHRIVCSCIISYRVYPIIYRT